MEKIELELAKSLVDMKSDLSLPQSRIIPPLEIKTEDNKGVDKKPARELFRFNNTEFKPIKSKV